MRCPFCGCEDTQVKDSRPSEDGAAIRRRRSCPECDARFTTFERVQLRELTVLKSDGTKEAFDRDKIVRSMRIALRKRPIEDEKFEQLVNRLVREMETGGDSEITTRAIGHMVMESLRLLDHVAYVRYASVYRDFRTPDDFNEFVDSLKNEGE